MKPSDVLLTRPSIEPLEARIAPAGVFTFVDTDGDAVTVSSSRGTNADLAAAIQPFLSASGLGFQLQKVALNTAPAIFKGTTLVISAAPAGGGNGFVDVGYIDATALDLNSVTIDGDLGRIDAGDSNVQTAALRSLSAVSIGVRGVETQEAGGHLVSNVFGSIGSLVLTGDLRNAKFQVLGSAVDPDPNTHSSIDAAAKIGALRIGGSVIGNDESGTGQIIAKGRIGTITVGGSIVGGEGAESGRIWTEGGFNSVVIEGSLIGGPAPGATTSGSLFGGGKSGKVLVKGKLIGGGGVESGLISNGRGLDSVTILGGIEGGSGLRSGTVASAGKIGLVSITGGIIGGSGEESGAVRSSLNLQTVKIVGDVRGGEGNRSGIIASAGVIGTVTIEGSIFGGDGEQSGAVGSIGNMGAVKVTGDVRGSAGPRSGQIVSEGTIKSVTIDGSVVGGAAFESGAIGSFGGLGPVKIGGDLIAGVGANSGTIQAAAEDSESGPPAFIKSVTVGGDITAILDNRVEAGPNAGGIFTDGALGPVVVLGDVEGGEEEYTSTIIGHTIKNVRIDGSLIGGQGRFSGAIVSASDMGAVKIGGSIVGAPGNESGKVSSGGKLASLTVGGSLVGGSGHYDTDPSQPGQVFAAGALGPVEISEHISGRDGRHSGEIRAASIKSVSIGTWLEGGSADFSGGLTSTVGDIGPIVMGASIDGGSAPVSGFIISARDLTSLRTEALGTEVGGRSLISAARKIGSIVIVESAEYADIIAGIDITQHPTLAASRIDSVVIGVGHDGEFTPFIRGTNIVAGALPGDDGDFGTFDDESFSGGEGPLSSIGSVVINGEVLDPIGRFAIPPIAISGTNFGIVADHIVKVIVSGRTITQQSGPRNDYVPIGESTLAINEMGDIGHGGG